MTNGMCEVQGLDLRETGRLYDLVLIFNDAFMDTAFSDASLGLQWLLKKYADNPKALEVVSDVFVALCDESLVTLINKAKGWKHD